MSIRDINMQLLDTLEDICIDTERIPNKNLELENKIKNALDLILEIRKLEISRLNQKGINFV